MAKNIVITGASDGIGASLAGRLVDAGHTVSIVGRNPLKTTAVARRLGVKGYLADFTRLADVRRLGDELRTEHPRIDVLINNAGTWFDEFALTEDGFERTLQCNALAPALLTELLLASLRRPGDAPPATVQWTSSTSSRWVRRFDPARIGLDDEQARATYQNLRVYGTSKLVGNLYVAEFQRQHLDDGIASVSVHPGLVATSFGTNGEGSRVSGLMKTFLAKRVLTTPERSAARLQHFAEGTGGVDWIPGDYYEGRRHRRQRQLLDDGLRRDLWARVRGLLGLP
ncbi:MAG: SDR family NAD(P)-dependent oxidoreductase [Promicromonosporaceae bacterium]|nr:SDR family NAD(P)-dependent oxidoreductase [Promicromonosporaceae bacterium]